MQLTERTNPETHVKEASDSLVYRTFQPGDETPFRELNEAWVSRYFVIEPRDHEVLDNPKEAILQIGGEILFATVGGRIIGCCALVPISEGCFEVSKMTIADGYRNRGFGRELLAAVLEQARQMGASRLYLETSRKLVNAIHVYETAGFTHVPPHRVHLSPYARADVYMEMTLS